MNVPAFRSVTVSTESGKIISILRFESNDSGEKLSPAHFSLIPRDLYSKYWYVRKELVGVFREEYLRNIECEKIIYSGRLTDVVNLEVLAERIEGIIGKKYGRHEKTGKLRRDTERARKFYEQQRNSVGRSRNNRT